MQLLMVTQLSHGAVLATVVRRSGNTPAATNRERRSPSPPLAKFSRLMTRYTGSPVRPGSSTPRSPTPIQAPSPPQPSSDTTTTAQGEIHHIITTVQDAAAGIAKASVIPGTSVAIVPEEEWRGEAAATASECYRSAQTVLYSNSKLYKLTRVFPHSHPERRQHRGRRHVAFKVDRFGTIQVTYPRRRHHPNSTSRATLAEPEDSSEPRVDPVEYRRRVKEYSQLA